MLRAQFLALLADSRITSVSEIRLKKENIGHIQVLVQEHHENSVRGGGGGMRD